MKCYKCKKDKLESDFSFKNKKLNIRQSECRSCFAEIRKKWYERNKSDHIKNIKRNKNKYLEIVQSFICSWLDEHPCVDCGESDIDTLDFDHINPEEKEYSVMYLLGGWSIERIKEEMQKCEVRCKNCHSKRHSKIRNSYRYRWKTKMLQ